MIPQCAKLCRLRPDISFKWISDSCFLFCSVYTFEIFSVRSKHILLKKNSYLHPCNLCTAVYHDFCPTELFWNGWIWDTWKSAEGVQAVALLKMLQFISCNTGLWYGLLICHCQEVCKKANKYSQAASLISNRQCHWYCPFLPSYVINLFAGML